MDQSAEPQLSTDRLWWWTGSEWISSVPILHRPMKVLFSLPPAEQEMLTTMPTGARIAVDTETTGWWQHRKVTVVSMAWRDAQRQLQSVVIPFGQGGHDGKVYWATEDLWNLILDILFGSRLVMFNAGFDLGVFKYGTARDLGLDLSAALESDCMEVEGRVQGGGGGLKLTAARYKVQGGHEVDASNDLDSWLETQGIQKWQMSHAPWPLVAPYARQDAVLTLLVHEAQRRLQGERDNGMVPFPATTGQPRVVVSRKMQAPSGFETAFAGRHVVFTGEMEAIERNVAEALVQAEGGTTSAAISGKTDLVVVGEKPGPSKLTKAKQLGLQVLGEDEFLAMAGKTSVTAEAIAWLDEFVPAGWSPIPTPAGLPHSKSEVLAFKPTGQDSWEFLLLAGVFASEWEGLQRRWAAYLALDNPTLIKKRGAKSLDEALEIFQGVSVNKDSNWSQFEQVWSEDSIAAAFGEEGEPGNAAKLRRLGNVTIATWNSLLELAVHAKEGQTCSEMTEACGAHIELFNIGLWQILKMMSTTVNQAGLVLAGQTAPDGSALTFDIAMDLTPNPQLLERLTKAVKQAAKLELGLFAQHAQAGKLISARVSR